MIHVTLNIISVFMVRRACVGCFHFLQSLQAPLLLPSIIQSFV